MLNSGSAQGRPPAPPHSARLSAYPAAEIFRIPPYFVLNFYTPMICCGMKCCESSKHIILVVGSTEDKKAFYKNVLDIDVEDKSFAEHEIKYNSVPLIIQSVETGHGMEEVEELHARSSCGVVHLTREDIPAEYPSYTLFVLIGSESRQTPEQRTMVSSVLGGSWEDCKQGFNTLVKGLSEH